MTKRIQIGSFASAHGVRGQVCVRSFTENPKDILRYAPLTDESGARVFVLTFTGSKGDDLIVSVEGISDRNEAERLRGTALYALQSALPATDENEWFINDLVGLTATAEGKPYGRVIGVHNFGAGDILELERTDGKNEMLPFTKAFVGAVNEKTGTIEIFPPVYLEGKAE